MSRSLLSLFALDAAALLAFGEELHRVLSTDDRDALSLLLDLRGDFVERARGVPRAVDLFLVPESDPSRAGLYASLRRVAKKRALSLAWTSESPALEGRLREYDLLRADPDVARRVDELLDRRRVPWFLQRPGATAGRLGDTDRAALAEALLRLEEPPPELEAFGRALEELDGDAFCHDGLA